MPDPIRTEIQPAEAPADAPAAPADNGDRPEWLPEQFKSGEDLAKAYSELRSKMDGGKESPLNNNPDPKPKGEEAEKPAAGGADGLPYSPEELDSWSESYRESGTIPDEAYATLAERGFSKELVDTFMRGKQAEFDQTQAKFLEVAGGQDAYTKQIAWASENWSEEDIASFNETLESGSFDEVTEALTGLRDSYTKANPKSPVTKLSQRGGGGTGGYATQAEMLSAMRDPRYWSDEAYRATVEQKIALSNF